MHTHIQARVCSHTHTFRERERNAYKQTDRQCGNLRGTDVVNPQSLTGRFGGADQGPAAARGLRFPDHPAAHGQRGWGSVLAALPLPCLPHEIPGRSRQLTPAAGHLLRLQGCQQLVDCQTPQQVMISLTGNCEAFRQVIVRHLTDLKVEAALVSSRSCITA